MEITTERLMLRRLTFDDLDELVFIHADPAIAEFVPFPREEAENWLRAVDESWELHGYGRMAIIDRVNGLLLGRTGLRWFPSLADTELGWTLRREAWGSGYATEAAQATADWAFRTFGMNYLISLIERTNERSIQVARRLAMKVLREEILFERPMVVHSLARSIDSHS